MVNTIEFIAIFCVIFVKNIAPEKQTEIINWNNVQPGVLLHRLDSLVSGRERNSSLEDTGKRSLKDKQLQKIQQPFERRADENVENNKSFENPYDYDGAYDAFVKKYFDDSVSDVSKTKSDDDPYSGEELATSGEDEELAIGETKQSSKSEKCRKVVRNQRSCVICKNTRNGETSESCSYNKETTPTNYAFKKGNEYRKYREIIPTDANENSSEEKPVEHDKSSGGHPTCTEKRKGRKMCYYCINHRGEKMVSCYSDSEANLNSGEDTNVQRSHQRIYKRTVMYKYKNVPLVTRADEKASPISAEKKIAMS